MQLIKNIFQLQL